MSFLELSVDNIFVMVVGSGEKSWR